jgi:carbon-monoxide dehydrogenase medium subunit
LAHNDPSAEYPLIGALLDVELVIAGLGATRRTPFRDFSLGHYTTTLEPGEIVTEVRVPTQPPGTGSAFQEVARRHGDFALVSAGAVVSLDNDRVSEARVALGGVDATPVRVTGAELMLRGRALDEDALEAAAQTASDLVSPASDLHGSADYRRHLCRVLVKRCLTEAYHDARR